MYLKLTNGQPETYSIGQLRRDNKNVSFPKSISDDTLARFGVYPYTQQDRPTYDNRTQKIEVGDFIETETGWERSWTIVDKTSEEIAEYDTRMISSVKIEAQRRILSIIPEWKQRNLTARAAELAIKGSVNWTAEEQAEYEAGQAVWDSIKAVRTKSDALESMSPIPEDYTDDKYWS